MSISKQDKLENLLLLKSICCVLLTAGAVLLLMRHADPVIEKNKFYGGSVSLLLAQDQRDINDFRRWTDLNDPSRIFGYRSAGIFFSSVKKQSPLTLPSVWISRPENTDMALYRSAEQKNLPLEFEARSGKVSFQPISVSPQGTPMVLTGVPVFDEQGNVLTRLQGIPDTNTINALLIKVRKGIAGSECRIVESSGDRNFDRSVTGALEKFLGKTREVSGIFAVWPDSKEKKK